MFLAIFEVHPKAELFDEYLALAKRLRPTLEKIDGFVDNERFQSKRRAGWVLSLSTWRDEKSMVRWRTTGVHHIAQKRGRAEILEDYHLRIGDVTVDTERRTICQSTSSGSTRQMLAQNLQRSPSSRRSSRHSM